MGKMEYRLIIDYCTIKAPLRYIRRLWGKSMTDIPRPKPPLTSFSAKQDQ